MTVGSRVKKDRRAAGVVHVRKPKTPTPVELRSHTWRRRWNPKGGRWEFKPTKLAVARYGLKDLGWGKASKYLTLTGKIRKDARVES